jgi:hypothetical protein
MKKLTLTIVAFLGLFVGAMAQTATHGVDITINSVAMLRAVNATATTAANSGFTVEAPTTAGAVPKTTAIKTGELYLQYTSIKTATGTPRTIKAVLSGTIPAGLSISAIAYTSGTGDVGISNDTQTISATAATMIKNIGSCYTGIVAGNGASIYYSSEITAMADLKVTAATALTVTYTLSNE